MKRLLMLALLALTTASAALWAIPATINYQGSLKEKGLPVTGTKQMLFRITDATGQQVYWSSLSTPVTVTNGLFAVPLTPSGVNWETTTPYIEVSVEGQMLLPREPLSSTVYAAVSNSVVDGAITLSKLDSSVQNLLVQPGSVMAFAGQVAPSGWLICDGSAVNRTTYASLFTAIGVAWGSGNGASTFNLPDFRGRAPIGAGQGVGLTNRPLTQFIGEETHLLTVAELPSHNHGVVDPGHHHRLSSLGAPALNTPPFNTVPHGSGGFMQDNGMIEDSVTGISIQNNGGSSAHNNMPPSLAVNFIIKY